MKGITNELNNCYVNSLMQCLYNNQIIRNLVLSSHTGFDTPMSAKFRQLFIEYADKRNTDDLNSTGLRNQFTFEKDHDRDGQQDPSELFVHLMSHPRSLNGLCSVNMITHTKCKGQKEEVRIDKAEYVTISLHNPPKSPLSFLTPVTTIQKLLQFNLHKKWERMPQSNCSTLIEYTNFSSTVVFVLQVTEYNREEKKTQKIQDFALNIGSKDICIDDKLDGKPDVVNKCYEFNAAIFHNGEDLNSGHYIAMVKRNGTLIQVNDDIISYGKWPRNSRDLYMLFYVRKSNVKH